MLQNRIRKKQLDYTWPSFVENSLYDDVYDTVLQSITLNSIFEKMDNLNRTYIIAWNSPQKQVFERSDDGSLVMYPGTNIFLTESKFQAMTLGKSITGKISRFGIKEFFIGVLYEAPSWRQDLRTITLMESYPFISLTVIPKIFDFDWLYPVL